MNLLELAKTVTKKRRNHSILLYGPPKTGKTRFVGTAAQIPEVNRIFWFDGENGAETLLHMGLSDAELSKITLYPIPDTREVPRFIETMLKAFSSKTPIKICLEHGKVGCVECAKEKLPEQSFCLKDCNHDDLVVIDSGSQLGDSALAMACAGKDVTYKPGWDEYGLVVKWLSDIMSVIQAAAYTNFVLLTHTIPIEEEYNGIKKDRFYPLCGTKAFCSKVAKYFGTVGYLDIRMGKHIAGSGSTYRADLTTGSRVNAKLESSKEPTMRDILIEGGIITPRTN